MTVVEGGSQGMVRRYGPADFPRLVESLQGEEADGMFASGRAGGISPLPSRAIQEIFGPAALCASRGTVSVDGR